MKPCTAFELPAPEANRTGWPWIVDSSPLPETLADGKPWPKISIVTPSFNQAQYIEETIRSILLQGYPHLEYFILDGGSTDGSVEIIKKYEPWLSGWVSQRDGGQSDAINQGFARCTGEIFNWICSDDLLTPGSLRAVAEAFAEQPACDVVAGNCYLQYDGAPEKNVTRSCGRDLFDRLPFIAPIWQPSCFFRKSLVTRSELARRDLKFCMDRELWAYLHSRRARWRWLDKTLSVYRFTGENKSMTGGRKIIAELDDIYRSYIKDAVPLTFWLRNVWLPLVCVTKRHQSPSVRLCCHLASRAIGLGLLLTYPKDRLRAMQREFYLYEMW
jgi:glycosyltransferase involved in cell wall biosynthesis